MESRFSQDFSRVSIHSDDRAARSVRELGAQAYTVGSQVVFNRGRYQPDTAAGRRLLAHELAHVVQQRAGRDGGVGGGDGGDTLERDAERAAASVSRGQAAGVRGSAAAGSLQCFRHEHRGRTFEVGDAQLTNAQAVTDVTRHGVLFPGPDQAHVLVHGRRLAYDVNHTTPDDPFRWERFKEIVDSGHADIEAVSMTQDFPVLEVMGNQQQVVRRSLGMFMASGMTLPTLARQRGINPGANAIVASADPARDAVFYESGRGGRGILGSNSLAHELFGHLWLAMRGASFQHGRRVTGTQNVVDPFNRPFVGEVDTFIRDFAGSAAGAAIQSPTQGVGATHLQTHLSWIETNGGTNLRGTVGGAWSATSDFNEHWQLLTNNYEALRANPTSRAAPRATNPLEILSRVALWHSQLPADPRYVFEQFLDATRLQMSGPTLRTRLARDVSQLIATSARHETAGEMIRIGAPASLSQIVSDPRVTAAGLDRVALARLNPELPASGAVPAGTTVWLKARIVPALEGGLERVGEHYFGGRLRWPAVWAMNPQIRDPNQLGLGTDIFITSEEDRRRFGTVTLSGDSALL